MKLTNQVVLITGCSSGIGLEAALLFAKKGAKVYATMRNLKKRGALEKRAKEEGVQLSILPLDVTKTASIKKAISTIVKKEKQIHVLLNNAGYGLFGPIGELKMHQIRAQFNTNFFGLVECIQLCLPHMKPGARILNVSSTVGSFGVPLMGAYCASKFAVEGLTESLRRELYKQEIYVTSVKPGATATQFQPSLQFGVDKKKFQKSLERRKKARGSVDSAQRVAKDIVSIAQKKRPAVRYGVGFQGKTIKVAESLVPDDLIDWMVRKVL